jgi:signal transduction histidine kinase
MEPAAPTPARGSLADRAYRQTSAVGIGTGLVWVVAWAWCGLGTTVLIGVLGLAAMISARVRRDRLGYPLATRISVLSSYLVIIAGILETGGMDGPFGVTLLILPLGPALALGSEECLRWSVIVLVTGMGLWGAESLIGEFPGSHWEGVAGLRALAQLTVLACTTLCLFTYGRMHELARQRLRASRGDLEQANRELQLSQQKLVLSEKMAALGRLTAGMAHEINSTLAGAINSLELARVDSDALAPEVEKCGGEAVALNREVVESIALSLTALAKIAAFVKRMRGQTSAFQVDEHTTFSATDEAETVLRLLQVSMLDRRITLETDIGRDARLRGDPARFGQIVQNLVTNAIDAYEGRPGKVQVRVGGEDGQVRLEVADEGSGIPEEIRGRIFEHFFTTKGIGEGTGLGLALVHDLATGYFGGTIEFDSEVGRGTRFLVRLPAAPHEGP